MKEILIIEDDRGLNEGIAIGLGSPDCHFTGCFTLAQARGVLAEKKGGFDLVILDLNLPDGNGYTFLKEYREKSDAPVLVLTANDLEMNEVMGFELGANDYVTKPFSLAVLRARISNLLKIRENRKEESSAGRGKYEDGSLYLDTAKMRFEKGGREIFLSRTEQKLLQILLENRGNTIPKEVLLEKIWQDGAEYVEDNALSVAVKRLRTKIEDNPSKPEHIVNIYGIGYVWK